MSQSFEDYVKESHPDIVEAYHRLQEGMPKIGACVQPLTYGYGDHEVLRVTKIDDTYIWLRCGQQEYLCKQDTWQTDLKVLTDEACDDCDCEDTEGVAN